MLATDKRVWHMLYVADFGTRVLRTGNADVAAPREAYRQVCERAPRTARTRARTTRTQARTHTRIHEHTCICTHMSTHV